MTARLYVRNVDGDMEEVPTFPSEGWTVEESAEEGNASSTSVDIPDPDMEYDFYSLRRAIVYEDESESDDQVLFSGFIGPHEVGRSIGKFVEPLARTWSVSLDDMNSLWGNRVLVGSDTDRPEETDVERMTWLVDTEEMGYFDNLDWLFTDDPEDLDERDVARQSVKSVADESSQQSGKNYWIGATGNVTDGTDIFVWYGNDSHEEYESPLRLSNVPGDWDTDELADGTSVTWPVSFDTKLARTGERIYDGVVVEYENGAEYVKNTATTALFTLSGRDLVHPAPEIKTAARAIRRGQRLLTDLDSMDEVLTCTVELPASKATMIRAGMRILVKATHLPGWEDFGWARIMKCSVSPMHGGTHYALTLTIQGPSSTPPGGQLQFKLVNGYPVTANEIVLDQPPGVGNLLVLFLSDRNVGQAAPVSGEWTTITTTTGVDNASSWMGYRIVQPGDDQTWAIGTSIGVIAEFEFAGSAPATDASATGLNSSSPGVGISAGGSARLIVAGIVTNNHNIPSDHDATGDSPFLTPVADEYEYTSTAGGPNLAFLYLLDPAAGAYTPSISYTPGFGGYAASYWQAIAAVFE